LLGVLDALRFVDEAYKHGKPNFWQQAQVSN
jgi:hypothetical protein